MRYPLDHFFALTGWSMTDVQREAPCNAAEWRKRRTEGVTERIADRIACAAGLHPHTVWPEMLEHALEDASKVCEECGASFVPPPKVPYKRFCGRPCQARNAARRRYHADPVHRETVKAAARRYHREYRRRQRSREQRRAA